MPQEPQKPGNIDRERGAPANPPLKHPSPRSISRRATQSRHYRIGLTTLAEITERLRGRTTFECSISNTMMTAELLFVTRVFGHCSDEAEPSEFFEVLGGQRDEDIDTVFGE